MTNLEKAIAGLNPEQRKAVDTIEGPVMVIAGPGTGKTQMLALRIANILKETDTNPEEILCITFTEAGTRAMRERLLRYIGTAAHYVSIHTFHSFANDIIQSNPEDFAFAKELTQLDDLKRIQILQSLLDAFAPEGNSEESFEYLVPFYDPYAKIPQITSSIQGLKKEGMSPADFHSEVDRLLAEHEDAVVLRNGKPTKKWQDEKKKLLTSKEFGKLYEIYQQTLLDGGYYDYEDMILYVINKFREDDAFLARYQQQYLYIHVDEYQDTNGAQNELIHALTETDFDDSPNIFTVGDDDQAIYRFQGANIENIIAFKDNFTHVQTVTVTTNYRSTQVILDIADSLIQNNERRLVNTYEDIEKGLKAGKNEQAKKAEVFEFANGVEEGIFIAEKIKSLKDSGVALDEIALIYRNNSHGDDIQEILEKFEIPTKRPTKNNILQSKSVSEVLLILRVLNLFETNVHEHLYQLLILPYIDVDSIDVYRVAKHSYRKRIELFEVLLDIENLSADLGISNPQKLIEIRDLILKMHKASQTEHVKVLIEKILEEFGITEYYQRHNEYGDEVDVSFEDMLAIQAFHSYVSSQVSLQPNLKLDSFLKNLSLLENYNVQLSSKVISTSNDAVNLITAHSSKGLEFEYVFIIKCTDKNFGKAGRYTSLIPKSLVITDESLEKQTQIEDERRLFFVAITRAKTGLYFTYAKEYETNGTVSNPSPSIFLSEIKNNLLVRHTAEDSGVEINESTIATLLKPKTDLAYSEKEREYLLEQVERFKLSASSLNEYIRSPREFLENRLLRVPRAKDKYLALGTASHYALERLNRVSMEKDRLISLDEFIAAFEMKLKDEYYEYSDFDRVKLEGQELLSKYYAYYIAAGNYTKPIESEYNFYFHNVLMPTSDGSAPIPLSGQIDKIEMISEATGSVRVIDYKTGNVKTEGEIKGTTANSDGAIWRQLVFYKLLGDTDAQFRPRKSFSKPKYVVNEATIDFMKEKSKGEFIKRNFEITNADVEKLKDTVEIVFTNIRNLHFPENFEVDLTEVG